MFRGWCGIKALGVPSTLAICPTVSNINTVIIPFNVAPGLWAKTCQVKQIGFFCAHREGDDRGWDGCMASPTRWTWVWVSSRSWWWTRKSGMLQSMGSQRVRHYWATEQKYCKDFIVSNKISEFCMWLKFLCNCWPQLKDFTKWNLCKICGQNI